MKCHYTNDIIAGKVLIPECMGVAVSNDLADCTCDSIPNYVKFSDYKKLESENKDLIKENKVFKEGLLFFIKAILKAPMTTLIGELQEVLKQCLIKTNKK